MSTPRGWSSQEKDAYLTQEFVTVEPIREKQFGLSTLSHQFVRAIASDLAEAGSTTTVIVATAHSAKVGDVVEFTSGSLSGQEVKVFAVDTNSITLAEALAAAPGAGDGFDILRHKYPVVDASGQLPVSISAAPIQYVRDTVDTEVNKDTGTPGNTRPLPVEIVLANGTEVSPATETTLSTLNGKVTAVDTGNVTVASSALPTGAATEATLSALNGKVTAVDTGAVTVAASALPTGAATEATLSSLNGKVTAVNTGAVVVSSSALPTGASTLAEQQTQTTHLSNIATSVDGKAKVELIRNVYSSVNVTTAAYVQLVASTSGEINWIDIFDSSGETLVLATGAAAAEVDQVYIFPGGNQKIPLQIAAGTRISVKAISATASVGELLINCLS